MSHLFIPTLRENPAEAEIISHQLMLRAGLIRSLSSGLYTWLPLGLRVLQKVENIIRQELDAINAQELRMPCTQPAELWQETQRWEKFGNQLLKMHDRHHRDYCFGPTHEEVITDILRKEIHSYKQLPVNLYQFTTKFRDEIRPRFGVMRSREFLMKDAYSFHLDEPCLQTTYETMHKAYQNIFTKLGLNFRAVLADTGAIGGQLSHEFQVLAESGEDTIVYSDSSHYAANIEQASPLILPINEPEDFAELTKIATPRLSNVASVSHGLNISQQQIIKTLIVKGIDDTFVALCLRGDHELNVTKVEKLPQIAKPLQFASAEVILKIFSCNPGSIGPVGCPILLILDHSARQLHNFYCGANQNDYHYSGVNWLRDCGSFEVTDLRNVVAGEPSPDGKGNLCFAKGIEVGHIFQVGTGYSKAMQATVVNAEGQHVYPIMGCYGIGVSRVVAAAIEQNHDADGIIWPLSMAPFDIAIVPIQYHKDGAVKSATDELYNELRTRGFSVLIDDRNERPGVMFKDIDLIGIPHRVTVSPKLLADQHIEYKARRSEKTEVYPIKEIFNLFQSAD